MLDRGSWPREALLWTALWLGFGLIASIAAPPLLDDRSGQVWTWVSVAVPLGLLGGWLLRPRRGWLIGGAIALLSFGVLMGAFQGWLAATTLVGSAERVRAVGLGLTGATTSLEGAVGAYLSWRLPSTEDAMVIRFEARLASPSVGPTPWQERTTGLLLEAAGAGDEVLTFVSAVSVEEGVIAQIRPTARSLGGRTFRVRIEARGELQAGGTRPLLTMSDQQGIHRLHLELPVSSGWRSFESVWQVPEQATDNALVITLSRLGGHALELGPLEVNELDGDRWSTLETADLLMVRLGQTETSLPLTETWQRYEARTGTTPAGEVEARFTVGSGTTALVRAVSVSSLATGVQLPRSPRPMRVRYLGAHANQLGHSAATVLAAVLAVGAGLPAIAVAAGLTLANLWMAGSRAALVGTLMALALFLPSLRGRHRLWLPGVLLLVVGAAYLVWGTAGWDRSAGETPTSREAIWSTAWSAVADHPLRGLPSSFADYWRERQGTSGEISHAHNLWLQIAVTYGIPGLLAMLWLTLGLILFAWRLGRWRGMILVIPPLLMNLFDYTLFHPSVLFPMILGMSALRRPQESASHGRAQVMVGRGQGILPKVEGG